MNPKLLSIFLISLFLISCEKHIKDYYPDETGCEQWAGKYDMYDPENDIHYDMTISCSHGTIFGSTQWDSMHFSNSANLFSFGQGVGSNGTLGSTIIQPLYDKNGYRWTFSNVYYPDTINRINVRILDSIYLRMNYNNQAFWIDDGVQYQTFTSVHSGKKIH